MISVIWTLIVVIGALIGIPLLLYVLVQVITVAYLRAKDRYNQEHGPPIEPDIENPFPFNFKLKNGDEDHASPN